MSYKTLSYSYWIKKLTVSVSSRVDHPLVDRVHHVVDYDRAISIFRVDRVVIVIYRGATRTSFLVSDFAYARANVIAIYPF